MNVEGLQELEFNDHECLHNVSLQPIRLFRRYIRVGYVIMGYVTNGPFQNKAITDYADMK